MEMAWATAARVACAPLSGLSIMKVHVARDLHRQLAAVQPGTTTNSVVALGEQFERSALSP
jgi:hypothetical protein